MIFNETILRGAFIVEPEKLEDERGFFARTWCQREFGEHRLNPNWVQCDISFNKENGTLRGMHYQAFPHEEAKFVRCTKGEVFDVIIDLRPGSQSFKQWISAELTEENRRMLYIPKGFAHGFLTLKDNTEVSYQISEFYTPESARGVRWNDPSFGINWPSEVRVISNRDQNFSDFIQ